MTFESLMFLEVFHFFFDVFIERCSSRFEMVEKVTMKILGQKGVS